VISALVSTTVTVTLVLAAWAGWLAARDRAAGRGVLAGLAVTELLLAVQAGLALVRLVGGAGAMSGAGEVVTFLAYLVGSLAALPLGGVWAHGERTRWGAAVVAVAALTTTVLIVRLQVIWVGTGG
jgi:hypothetical protein